MPDVIGGQIKAAPILFHEWIISCFMSLNCTRLVSPEFTVKNTKFQLVGLLNGKPSKFWLQNSSKKPLELTLFKIDIISCNGSEMTILHKENVAFPEHKTYPYLYFDPYIPDASIETEELAPSFLPNGELRLRCRIVVKSDEQDDFSIMDLMNKANIIDDLRKATDFKDMTFADVELVRLVTIFRETKYLVVSISRRLNLTQQKGSLPMSA